MNSRFFPDSFEIHHCSDSSRYSCSIADSLGSRLCICSFVAAIIINIIGLSLPILNTFNPASNRCFALVILSKLPRIGKYGFQEPDWYNLPALKQDRFNSRHTDILYNAQMCKVLLPKSHPEPGTFQSREIFDKRFQLLMINQIRLHWSYSRISK